MRAVKNAIDKDNRNNKWLNILISNKNVKEDHTLSGIISQMIKNVTPHPHDDDSKRIDEIYKDLQFYDDVNCNKELDKDMAVHFGSRLLGKQCLGYVK